MLEEEVDDIKKKRLELDEIITDLYELAPLLEKCETDTVINEYRECETMSLTLTEWHIRSKPLLKNIVSWLNMYYEQKIDIYDKTGELNKKIKNLRHSILATLNKS
jgi:hypothetical protein